LKPNFKPDDNEGKSNCQIDSLCRTKLKLHKYKTILLQRWKIKVALESEIKADIRSFNVVLAIKFLVRRFQISHSADMTLKIDNITHEPDSAKLMVTSIANLKLNLLELRRDVLYGIWSHFLLDSGYLQWAVVLVQPRGQLSFYCLQSSEDYIYDWWLFQRNQKAQT
jgi:hypothetical protein